MIADSPAQQALTWGSVFQEIYLLLAIQKQWQELNQN
jgi:hypothetical protein